MKLTANAITAIDKADIRLKLALGLAFSETWIRSLIAANKDNGPLTTAKSLQVIREETGLQFEEILDSSEVKETAK